MSRRDEFKNDNPNPAKHFLEWRSKDKNLRYWDKAKEQNISVELPFKFLLLMELSTVKGWHDPSQSGIYSNEVRRTDEQELHVRSFKGGTIAKGFYNDIKDEVYREGGKYHKSLYVMTPKGELLNLSLSGPHVFAWGEFYSKGNRKRAEDEWIELYDVEQKQKGSNVFFVPKFRFNTSLTDDEDLTAEILYKDLKEYMNDYMERNDQKQAAEQVYRNAKEDAEQLESVLGNPNSPATQDDLPFG